MAKNYQRKSSADSRANAHQPTAKQLKSSVFQDNRHETALQRELKDLVPNQPKSAPAVTQQVAQCLITGVEEQTPYDITDLINKYNLLNDQVTLSTRINHLSNIEHAIYAWLIKNTVPDVSNNKLIMHVRSLMDAVKTERLVIVTRSVIKDKDHLNDKSDLPIAGFDSLDEKMQNQIREIWIRLINQTGQIKITETDKKNRTHEGYSMKILTEFSRLLEGKYGRKMVSNINESDKTITIQPFLFSDQDSNNSLGAEPVKKRPHLLKLDGEPNNKSVIKYPECDISKLNETQRIHFFNELKPKNENQLGVKVQDGIFTHYFEFKERDHVQIKFASDLNDSSMHGDSRLLNEKNQELATPVFILLGHELGHAIHMQRGTSTENINIPNFFCDKNDMVAYGGNMEEYVNIEGTENSLRREHGLGRRKGHGNILRLIYEKLNIKFNPIYNWLRDMPNPILKLDLFEKFSLEIGKIHNRLSKDWLFPELLPNLIKDVKTLPDKIKKMQLEYLHTDFREQIIAEKNYITIQLLKLEFSFPASSIIQMILDSLNREFDFEIMQSEIALKNNNLPQYLNSLSQQRHEYSQTFLPILFEQIESYLDENPNKPKDKLAYEKLKEVRKSFDNVNWLFK
jgi:hypothetical protein